MQSHISENELDQYYQSGFRQFHFANTLPVNNGVEWKNISTIYFKNYLNI